MNKKLNELRKTLEDYRIKLSDELSGFRQDLRKQTEIPTEGRMVTKKELNERIVSLQKDRDELRHAIWDARELIRKQTEILVEESVRVDVSKFGAESITYISSPVASAAEVLSLLVEHLGLEVHIRPDKVEQSPVYLQEKEKKDSQD